MASPSLDSNAQIKQPMQLLLNLAANADSLLLLQLSVLTLYSKHVFDPLAYWVCRVFLCSTTYRSPRD